MYFLPSELENMCVINYIEFFDFPQLNDEVKEEEFSQYKHSQLKRLTDLET